MSVQRVKSLIAPSLLSSDFAMLSSEAKRMLDCGADWLHMDIMDGHFVPNLTIGAPVIASLRKHTQGFIDCHLMVSNPEQWAEDYAKAGADQYTFHYEASGDAKALVSRVKGLGMRCGIAIKPATPVDDAFCGFVREATPDMVLVMTVEPGFGGQQFMGDMMPKVRTLRTAFPSLDIQVDGGLSPETIDAAADAGANVIVAGSAIFKSADPAATIAELRAPVDAKIASAA